MNIKEIMAYKYYSIYRLEIEKNDKDYLNNKISRELLNELGRKANVEIIENLKKVPENEKKLSFKAVVMEYIKEKEDMKNEQL